MRIYYYDVSPSISISITAPESGTGAAKESDVKAKAITRLKKRIVENNWLLVVADSDWDCGGRVRWQQVQGVWCVVRI